MFLRGLSLVTTQPRKLTNVSLVAHLTTISNLQKPHIPHSIETKLSPAILDQISTQIPDEPTFPPALQETDLKLVQKITFPWTLANVVNATQMKPPPNDTLAKPLATVLVPKSKKTFPTTILVVTQIPVPNS